MQAFKDKLHDKDNETGVVVDMAKEEPPQAKLFGVFSINYKLKAAIGTFVLTATAGIISSVV